MRKILFFLITGVVVVMAITFASYIVFTQFRPEREVGVMMGKMARLTSFAYDAGFGWSAGSDGESVSTTLYASGKVLASESGDVDHATKFRVVRLSRARDYNDLAGEIRNVGDTTFLTYSPPGPDVPGVDFDGETWVEFDEGELASWGEVLPGLEVPIESVTPEGEWTDDGIKRLRVLLSMMDVLLVEYNGLTEIIDGEVARIIDGRFDIDAVEGFLLNLVRAKYGDEPDDEDRIFAHAQAIQLARLDLRLWVGMNDHLLHCVRATGNFSVPPLPEGGLGGVGVKPSNESVPVEIRIEFSGFDEPVSILEPSAIDFASIYRTTFGSLPSAGDIASATRKTLVRAGLVHLPSVQMIESNDPDNDGLDNILETFYGTSALKADTDSDGINDGDEVRAGSNPRGRGSLFGFGLD
jgi:hypothetical protein